MADSISITALIIAILAAVAVIILMIIIFVGRSPVVNPVNNVPIWRSITGIGAAPTVTITPTAYSYYVAPAGVTSVTINRPVIPTLTATNGLVPLVPVLSSNNTPFIIYNSNTAPSVTRNVTVARTTRRSNGNNTGVAVGNATSTFNNATMNPNVTMNPNGTFNNATMNPTGAFYGNPNDFNLYTPMTFPNNNCAGPGVSFEGSSGSNPGPAVGASLPSNYTCPTGTGVSACPINTGFGAPANVGFGAPAMPGLVSVSSPGVATTPVPEVVQHITVSGATGTGAVTITGSTDIAPGSGGMFIWTGPSTAQRVL